MPLNEFHSNLFTILDTRLEYSNFLNFFSRIRGRNTKSKESEDNSSKSYKDHEYDDSLWDLIPDGVLVLDLSMRIKKANKAYFLLTGYTEKELIGKNILQTPIAQIPNKNEAIDLAKGVFTGKELFGWEFRYKHADGSLRWGEARARLNRTGLISGEVIAILRDITERKEHKEELMRMNLELERSNNDLDDYTFAVSHDLKAPLRTIESFSSFLLEDHSDNLDDEGKEYLQRMILATKKMNALIQDLLLISRVGRLHAEMELVDFNEVISEVVDDMETPLTERNGEIIYTKLPSIKTQKVWIKQVFSNLISNGLKFNESPNPRIWIKCEERKDHYILSVKDNGIGIDEKHHDKIFKIFQRLHTVNEYPGTGAGLTICKKIVESMGGTISLDSKPGKGSTFNITIPKGSETPEESEPPYQSDDSLSLVHGYTNNEH
jgi:PAS domain S-box-containing protein